MAQSISIRSVRDVRLGDRGQGIIAGTDHAGTETDVILRIQDALKVALASLACGAVEAAPARMGKMPAEIVESCHLPVMNWTVGRSTVDDVVVLTIQVPGGGQPSFQFAAQTAIEYARALDAGGRTALPDPGTKAV